MPDGPTGGVSGDGAEVAVRARLLEGDDELRRLPGLCQRRLFAVDLEVVQDVADVLEDERDGAGLRGRLRGEPEKELAAFDLDRGRRRVCSSCSCRASRGRCRGW